MTWDVVFSTRYDIKEGDIERFDIPVFISPDTPDITYIKRVIGFPGEIIEISGGKVYVDGVKLDSSFINEPQNQIGDGVYEVPEDCYFIIGDNRNSCNDSRFWANPYVSLENIQAKAKCIVFPFSDIGLLDYNWKSSKRWGGLRYRNSLFFLHIVPISTKLWYIILIQRFFGVKKL